MIARFSPSFLDAMRKAFYGCKTNGSHHVAAIRIGREAAHQNQTMSVSRAGLS